MHVGRDALKQGGAGHRLEQLGGEQLVEPQAVRGEADEGEHQPDRASGSEAGRRDQPV